MSRDFSWIMAASIVCQTTISNECIHAQTFWTEAFLVVFQEVKYPRIITLTLRSEERKH